MNLIFLKESYYRTYTDTLIQRLPFNYKKLEQYQVGSFRTGTIKNMVLLRKGNRTIFIKRLL